MTTLDILLEELGTPPRDICLDWAWQLQQLCNAKNHTADAIQLPLTWDSLEVNESGQLKLVREDSKSLSPDELLQQLLSWSASYAEQSNAFDASPSVLPSDLTSRLEVLTLAAFDTDIAESKSAIGATSIPHPGISGEEGWGNGAESPESRPLTLTLSPEYKGEGTRKMLSPEYKREGTRKMLSPEYKGEGTRKMLNTVTLLPGTRTRIVPGTRIRTRRLVVLVIAVVAIIPIAFYLTSVMEVEHGETQTAQSPTPSQALLAPVTSESSATHPAVVPKKRNAMQDNSPISPPELSISSPYGKVLEPNVTQQISEQETTGQRLLSGVDLSLPQAISNAPNVDMAMDGSAESEAENASTSTEHSQNDWAKSETLATDVLAELASVAHSADRLTSESEFMASEEAKGNKSEPLLIDTTPAVQIQKLPAKLASRPRQPVWRLAIAVDDGFTVSPTEPQALTERELAAWVITSDDAKPPRTSLAVQVQMSSGRQAALKWQIFAATEDFPNLTVPLGEKFLLPLQERLRQFTQMASQETERLKLLATSGVPSDLRTAINRQRAEIETRGKLAGRLLTFVASAQQLDDWLHGHVAVFAELRDGTASDSTLILRYGDLTDLASTEASEDSQKQLEMGKPEQGP